MASAPTAKPQSLSAQEMMERLRRIKKEIMDGRSPYYRPEPNPAALEAVSIAHSAPPDATPMEEVIDNSKSDHRPDAEPTSAQPPPPDMPVDSPSADKARTTRFGPPPPPPAIVSAPLRVSAPAEPFDSTMAGQNLPPRMQQKLKRLSITSAGSRSQSASSAGATSPAEHHPDKRPMPFAGLKNNQQQSNGNVQDSNGSQNGKSSAEPQGVPSYALMKAAPPPGAALPSRDRPPPMPPYTDNARQPYGDGTYGSGPYTARYPEEYDRQSDTARRGPPPDAYYRRDDYSNGPPKVREGDFPPREPPYDRAYPVAGEPNGLAASKQL